MFKIAEFKSVVRIVPEEWTKPRIEAITCELNRTLANKVVPNVGLCISLYDIIHIGDSYVIPGDGSSHIKVTFRYIVFRPSIDTVIYGKVKLCDSEGIHVGVNFFDDILIPQRYMPDFSVFNPVQSTWVWKYKSNDVTHDMPTEKGDPIRFKVVEDEFTDVTPPPSDLAKGDLIMETKSVPYRIIGKTSDSGLGLPSWWNQEEEADDEEEEGEGEEEEAEAEEASSD